MICDWSRALLRQMVWRSGSFWVGIMFALCLIVAAVMRSQGIWDADTYAIMTLLVFAIAAGLVLCVLSEILDAVRAVLWHKNSGLGTSRDFLRITNAGISVRTVVMPRKKIQFAWTRANPFQRRSKVATVAVRTAAGVSGTTEQLYDLSEQDAQALVEWVRPRRSAPRQAAEA